MVQQIEDSGDGNNGGGDEGGDEGGAEGGDEGGDEGNDNYLQITTARCQNNVMLDILKENNSGI